MDKPNVTLFAAKGRDSLSTAQCAALEAVAQVNYQSVLHTLPEAELIAHCSSAHYIALTRRVTKNFDSRMIEQLPQLRGLSIYATGSEWIDVEALQERAIRFTYLPDYCLTAVAEHTLAMLLTFSRRLHLSDRIARDELPKTVSIRGWELAGKKLGIIGMGRIGQRVASLASAFGMAVSYIDPQVPAVPGFQALAWDDLLAQSDVLVLTASMDRKNPIVLDNAAIARMKNGVYVINTARADMVDKHAMLHALLSKQVHGYGVDDYVFSDQELAQLEHGRVLQSGHSAWYSNEAMQRGTDMWVDNLLKMIREP
ncbi:2-hydroxyacid dehydrogenase [Undibacterium sp. Di27W]|uniref:2-hydroxyacid dehydrogenase n=1 Tax=Undibacterium sp. Di27W TaxID=3413036 RepID=UPI003BF3F1C1